jgi:ferredoxin-NADP reductase
MGKFRHKGRNQLPLCHEQWERTSHRKRNEGRHCSHRKEAGDRFRYMKTMTNWRVATLIHSEMAAKNVKILRFSAKQWKPHRPGQYYDIRITAEDGHRAKRSYSVASAPEDKGILEFAVELHKNGEVSPYLFGLQKGGQVETRGPTGGRFVWDVAIPGTLCLIGGGSGVIPLMTMLRHREKHLRDEKNRPVIFLVSVRSRDYLLYYDELRKISAQDPNFTLVLTFTREAPLNWGGYRRRIDTAMLKTVFGTTTKIMPTFYICGPTSFVETTADKLTEIGVNARKIRAESFGGK